MTTSAAVVVVTIAVVGSRTFRDYRLMCDTLDALCAAYDDNVLPRLVSGGAQGADKLAERYAAEHDLHCDVLKPLWRPNGVYDACAGKKRNTQIIARADVVVAFWDGFSAGTRDSITKAKSRGIKVHTVAF